jgi:hypothetical protein
MVGQAHSPAKRALEQGRSPWAGGYARAYRLRAWVIMPNHVQEKPTCSCAARERSSDKMNPSIIGYGMRRSWSALFATWRTTR